MDLSCIDDIGLQHAVAAFFALGSAAIVGYLGLKLSAYRLAIGRLLATIDRDRLGATIPLFVEDGPPAVARLARALNAIRCDHAERAAGHLDIQAGYAHDLRTPLTRLGLRSELIADGPLRDAMARDLAEMASLVEASLTCARLQRRAVVDTESADALCQLAKASDDGSASRQPAKPTAKVVELAQAGGNHAGRKASHNTRSMVAV